MMTVQEGDLTTDSQYLRSVDNKLPDQVSSQVPTVDAAGNASLSSIDEKVSPSTTITHDSITLTAADTEYSLAIPTGCKKLTFRTVQADGKTPGNDLLYAFATGKVDHPTLYEHMLLDGGAVYSESNLNLTSKTLYVAGITAGDIVLLEMWS